MANFPFFDDATGDVICLFCGCKASTFVDSDRDWTTLCNCKKYIKYTKLQEEIELLEKEATELQETLETKIEIANLERRLKTLKSNK